MQKINTKIIVLLISAIIILAGVYFALNYLKLKTAPKTTPAPIVFPQPTIVQPTTTQPTTPTQAPSLPPREKPRATSVEYKLFDPAKIQQSEYYQKEEALHIWNFPEDTKIYMPFDGYVKYTCADVGVSGYCIPRLRIDSLDGNITLGIMGEFIVNKKIIPGTSIVKSYEVKKGSILAEGLNKSETSTYLLITAYKEGKPAPELLKEFYPVK
jgi:hypothetical protein